LLAGKVVEFQVKVHDLKEKAVPELDDAFARSLGGNFQGLPDLRQAVREDMIKVKERERQARLESQAVDQLLAAHHFEVPPAMIRREQESLVREQLERLQQYGVQVAGMDPEKMLERARPGAERRVRARLILERIAAQEGLSVDAPELEGALADLAAKTGRELARVRQLYQEQGLLEPLRRQLRDEKTMKFILAKANLMSAAPERAQEQA
jgi:trigger factor